MARNSEGPRDTYERWEVEKLVDGKIKEAVREYDEVLKEFLKIWIVIQLEPYKPWLSAIKFIATAVALLVIGTLYQFFVSLASSGSGQ